MGLIYGWHNAPGTQADQAHALHCDTAANAVLQGGTQAPACSIDNNLQAAIVGAPRWVCQDLRAFSQAHGQPAALAEAWRRHGPDLLERLAGGFALALHDHATAQTLLAIDRLGTEALYHAQAGAAGLVFGSNARDLTRHTGIAADLSQQALYDYVYFHMIPSPGTVYRDISKLEPATCLLYSNGRPTMRTYWRPSFDTRLPVADTPALEEELLAGLRNALRRSGDHDQVGGFLSGGLDSSTVCGMYREVFRAPLRAYSIGFSADGYDEMEYARIAATRFGLDLRDYYVTADDIADSMHKIAAAYDEPFGNSSALPALACARRAAADGVQLMLAGDGGDEIFAGNERYARQKIFACYEQLPAWIRQRAVEPFTRSTVAGLSPLTRKLRSYVEQALVPMPERMETYNFLHRFGSSEVFDPGFLEAVDSAHPQQLLRSRYEDAGTTELLDRMLYLDWKITLADNDLRKVSRMCALAGVDVRYPLLDDDLLNLSVRIPSAVKLPGQRLRHFYKRALRDFLPREIISKRKHGFGLPFGVWLRESTRLQELIYASLADLRARRIVRTDFLDQLIATHRNGHAAYYGDLVWVLAMLELWLQAHVGRASP